MSPLTSKTTRRAYIAYIYRGEQTEKMARRAKFISCEELSQWEEKLLKVWRHDWRNQPKGPSRTVENVQSRLLQLHIASYFSVIAQSLDTMSKTYIYVLKLFVEFSDKILRTAIYNLICTSGIGSLVMHWKPIGNLSQTEVIMQAASATSQVQKSS